MKRVVLFILTNLAIVFVLNITLRMFGIEPYLSQRGMNLNGLLVFAAIFGFSGAFISLLLSKWSAKRMTRAQVIASPRNAAEQWLLETVRRQAQAAGIGMPEVAIFESADVNAFATGASRNHALVAFVSLGHPFRIQLFPTIFIVRISRNCFRFGHFRFAGLHVAVDADGGICEYGCKPKEHEFSQCWDTKDERDQVGSIFNVINWRETLTEVK